MAFDERVIAQKVLERAQQEMYDRLMVIAKTQPDVFRRGIKALLERKQTGAQQTAARADIKAMGERDPVELERALSAMVKASSFQEVLDLMGGGRQPKEKEGA